MSLGHAVGTDGRAHRAINDGDAVFQDFLKGMAHSFHDSDTCRASLIDLRGEFRGKVNEAFWGGNGRPSVSYYSGGVDVNVPAN